MAADTKLRIYFMSLVAKWYILWRTVHASKQKRRQTLEVCSTDWKTLRQLEYYSSHAVDRDSHEFFFAFGVTFLIMLRALHLAAATTVPERNS